MTLIDPAKHPFLTAFLNESETENGAATFATTTEPVLDLFFTAGAARTRSDSDIADMVSKAYEADPQLTLRLLFWARDVREGAGERRFFRVAMKSLAESYFSPALETIVRFVPIYGRWDDVLELLDTPLEAAAIELIHFGINTRDGLLGKWLPRQGEVATKLRKALGFKTPKEWRKLLVELSHTVEQQMCAREWSEINYSHVPSIAAKNYRKAFKKHDEKRYSEYVAALAKPESGVKVNAKAIFPHDIVKAVRHEFDDTAQALLDAQWRALPDFMGGSEGKRIIPVCDVSGSMESAYGTTVAPMDVSISLGLYISERNRGPFKNHFITFSTQPALVEVKGNTLKERATNLENADWGGSTDLNAVFKLILAQAQRHHLAQSDMPEVILIISDMEFNSATRTGRYGQKVTPFEEIQSDYAAAGYTAPKIVFWNVAARNEGNFPVIKDEPNTALISGFSPSILKPLLAGRIPNPTDVMLEVLNAPRYASITLDQN